MQTGYLQINGSGPRNAAVGVFDAEDNLLFETRTDQNGFWSIASVEMQVGTHQLRAKIRTDSGKEHISNLITTEVGDPDADIEIQAEALDPATVAEMQEIEAEEMEKAELRVAFQRLEELRENAIYGYEINDGQLWPVLSALGKDRDEFWLDVSEERARNAYSRMVCTAASGATLEDKDKSDIWRNYKKTEEQFAADVARVKRSAGIGWRSEIQE